jgi:hypothetical protein
MKEHLHRELADEEARVERLTDELADAKRHVTRLKQMLCIHKFSVAYWVHYPNEYIGDKGLRRHQCVLCGLKEDVT